MNCKEGGAQVLRGVTKNRDLSMEANMGMFEGIAVPTVLYGFEVWVLNARRKMIEVLENTCKCLQIVTGTRWLCRVRNNIIREMYGNQFNLPKKVD